MNLTKHLKPYYSQAERHDESMSAPDENFHNLKSFHVCKTGSPVFTTEKILLKKNLFQLQKTNPVFFFSTKKKRNDSTLEIF